MSEGNYHESLYAQFLYTVITFSGPTCPLGGRGGSNTSLRLQASRSSATKRRYYGGRSRQDQPISSAQSYHRVLRRPLGFRTTDVLLRAVFSLDKPM